MSSSSNADKAPRKHAVCDLVDVNSHRLRNLRAMGLSDEDIAMRLCNIPEMVRRMYEKAPTKHRNDKSNTSLDIVFGEEPRERE
jgi:hypothetical protein